MKSIVLALAFSSLMLQADTYLVVSPDSSFFTTANPNVIKAFDKDFFLPKEAPKLSSGRGDSRYFGEPIAYNSAQRLAWSEKCEPEKQKGMYYFRKCFRNEERKNREELDKNIDALNTRNNQPFRN